MISSVQRSPRMSIARPTLQNSGRSNSYMSADGSAPGVPNGTSLHTEWPVGRGPRDLPAEGGQLSGQADGVVVGHQEAGPLEHAELGVGEQVERLLGHRQ